jgi:hypothetical protein
MIHGQGIQKIKMKGHQLINKKPGKDDGTRVPPLLRTEMNG